MNGGGTWKEAKCWVLSGLCHAWADVTSPDGEFGEEGKKKEQNR